MKATIKAAKWTSKAGQIRVYLNCVQLSSAGATVYGYADAQGYAEIVIDGDIQKKQRNMILGLLSDAGFTSITKFDVLLAAAPEAATVADKSHGSAWANGFAQANGYYHDEA